MPAAEARKLDSSLFMGTTPYVGRHALRLPLLC